MCNLSDEELRQAANKSITEIVLNVIKEPSLSLFDAEYLRIAFKYFNSSTLTIRMAGLQQLTVSLLYLPRHLLGNQFNE